ncbi:hypothetical protein [Actinomadura oligospora]|uniref:hypothetical protein n=1 Tax=Actinomadura oligospora TaxID=111804 RepID=UPI0004B92D57|nr:hypothetical protein [Actinomadura oligospora]
MNPHLPELPEQLLRHLTRQRDAAQADVDRLTTELDHARQLLERLDITHQTLLAITRPQPTGPGPVPQPQLPPGYSQILTLLAGHPTASTPRTSPTPSARTPPARNTVEGISAKLKRLVGRDLATEPQKGLFTIKAPKT